MRRACRREPSRRRVADFHGARGASVEPMISDSVDNCSTAQEEIFRARAQRRSCRRQTSAIAIDTMYGLNAAVFTTEADRARDLAHRLRSGTPRGSFLEVETVILNGRPSTYQG